MWVTLALIQDDRVQREGGGEGGGSSAPIIR